MKKRIFIAINLDQATRRAIETEVQELKTLFHDRVRFVDSENWHITISFLDYQEDPAIGLIVRALQEYAPQLAAPEVHFEKIHYGPSDRDRRMIWLVGSSQASAKLGVIKKDLDDRFMEAGIRFKREHRLFQAHLTLVRFGYAPEALPALDRSIDCGFTAKSLDLMESVLKPAGPEYSLLSRFDFLSES